MPVIIHTIDDGNATPLTNARIMKDEFVSLSRVNLSVLPAGDTGTLDGLKYPTTYEGWAASTWGASTTKKLVATVATGAAIPVDAVMIAAHNIGELGVGIKFKLDDGTTTYETTTYYPTDNSPIMALFDVDTPISCEEITVTLVQVGGAWPTKKPVINVFQAGQCLVMPRPIFIDQVPADINTSVVLSNSKSIGGQALGFSVRRQGAETSYPWNYIPQDFVYDDFKEFKNYAEIGRGFFTIAWRPSFQPVTANISPGVQYGSLSGTIGHTITGNPDFLDIKMTVTSAGAVR